MSPQRPSQSSKQTLSSARAFTVSPSANSVSVQEGPKGPSPSQKTALAETRPPDRPAGSNSPSVFSSSPQRRALGSRLTPVRKTRTLTKRRSSSRLSSDPSSAFDIPADDNDNAARSNETGFEATTTDVPSVKRRRISSMFLFHNPHLALRYKAVFVVNMTMQVRDFLLKQDLMKLLKPTPT